MYPSGKQPIKNILQEKQSHDKPKADHLNPAALDYPARSYLATAVEALPNRLYGELLCTLNTCQSQSGVRRHAVAYKGIRAISAFILMRKCHLDLIKWLPTAAFMLIITPISFFLFFKQPMASAF